MGIKKHRRVIALSVVDEAKRNGRTPVEIVSDNLEGKGSAVFFQGNKAGKLTKVVAKKISNKVNKPTFSEHDKFLLEQCPPHFGKL